MAETRSFQVSTDPAELNTLLGAALPTGNWSLQNSGDSDIYYLERNAAIPDPSTLKGSRDAHVLRGSPFKDDVPITKGSGLFYFWTLEGVTIAALTEDA